MSYILAAVLQHLFGKTMESQTLSPAWVKVLLQMKSLHCSSEVCNAGIINPQQQFSIIKPTAFLCNLTQTTENTESPANPHFPHIGVDRDAD